MKRYLKIHDDDNIAIALEELPKGEKISMDGKTFIIKDRIPRGHKMAVKNIAEGHDVFKYGMAIGHATGNIKAGRHVHSHNLKSNRD